MLRKDKIREGNKDDFLKKAGLQLISKGRVKVIVIQTRKSIN